MKINVLTIFPEAFNEVLDFSIIKKAKEKGKVEFEVVNIRDFADDKHNVTDDMPFGGNEGMVMKVEPIVKALRSLELGVRNEKKKVLLTSAAGKKLTQQRVRGYSELDEITIICGRYEGVDERIVDYIDEEVSIGDYVLSGGEFAAMVVIDGIVRLIPGVLGNEDSSLNESFEKGILDHPQYTRPREYEGKEVPEELISGNHELIRVFRRKQALKKTLLNRPELLDNIELSKEDKKILKDLEKEQ